MLALPIIGAAGAICRSLRLIYLQNIGTRSAHMTPVFHCILSRFFFLFFGDYKTTLAVCFALSGFVVTFLPPAAVRPQPLKEYYRTPLFVCDTRPAYVFCFNPAFPPPSPNQQLCFLFAFRRDSQPLTIEISDTLLQSSLSPC